MKICTNVSMQCFSTAALTTDHWCQVALCEGSSALRASLCKFASVRVSHLDIFIEAVPVPLLEERKGHTLLHDARPHSAPEQVSLLKHLTPPAPALHASGQY